MPEIVDKTAHATVVEYAVRFLFKGKTPLAAAKATAKKLGGAENMFLGSGIAAIDPERLADLIWDRLVEFAISGIKHMSEGKEHFALDGTIAHFNQKDGIRSTLKAKVIAQLNRDPFTQDGT